MNPGLVVKLRPTGPWRIGPDSGARNRVDFIYHSDTLYSAVTGALAWLGSLDGWLAATARAAAPEVCFSSCFPFLDEIGFVVPPRTIWPPASPALMASRTRWKSARFVPLGIVQAILAGRTLKDSDWSVDGASQCLVPSGRPGPFRTDTRWNAAVDRLTGSSERHSTTCLEFRPGAGLWNVVSFRNEAARDRWLDPVKAAFRLLADTGFGGERSRGWGRAETPEFIEGQLPDVILPPAAAAAAVAEPVTPEPEVVAEPAAGAVPESEVVAEPAAEAASEPEVVGEPAAETAPEPVIETVPEPEATAEAADMPEVKAAPETVVETSAEARVEAPSGIAPLVLEAERIPDAPFAEIHEEPAEASAVVEPPQQTATPVEPAMALEPEATEPPVAGQTGEPAVPQPSEAEVGSVEPASEEPAVGVGISAGTAGTSARATEHWLLSLFTPAPDDAIDWSRGNYSLMIRGGRVESPAGSGEPKKLLQMISEGSVLCGVLAPTGSASDVAPEGFPHPVFRAGFAVAIPLPEGRS